MIREGADRSQRRRRSWYPGACASSCSAASPSRPLPGPSARCPLPTPSPPSPRPPVRRVQNLVETLDTLKARNANPFGNSTKAASVTTQWQTFETGVGSLAAPPPRAASTQTWEHLD